jgi:hypothetical protein
MLAHLQRAGDVRTIIGMVEAWAEIGTPTPAARVAAARAFVHLGLMDRAWARIEPVLEAGAGGREALEVTARAFAGRGWPSQARKALERAMADAPDDRALVDLWEAAIEPPTDADPGAIADDTDDDECAAAATRLVAHGALHRARILVERVLHRSPNHRHAADLQWALNGEFLLPGGDLAGVLARHETLSSLPDISDEPEATESRVSPEVLHALLEEADPHGGGATFPSLFRGMSQRAVDEEEGGEVTSAGAVFHPAAVPDLNDEAASGDDTQIRVVVDRSGVAAPVDSLAPFDLARFRADMGVDLEFVPPVEREDEDVVIRVRRDEAAGRAEAVSVELAGLGLDHRSDSGASLPLPPESVDWVRPSAPAPTRPPQPRVEPTRPRPAVAGWAIWVLALAMVSAFVLMVVWALVLGRLLSIL